MIKAKASTFNRTIVVNEKSREVIFRIFKKEYDSLPWHAVIDKNEIVKTLINMGMVSESDELIKNS